MGRDSARRISGKKLTDIARYLYAADGAEYCRSCRGLCVQRGATCSKPPVYQPNVDTVRVFLNLNWEYSPMGQPVGIRPGDIREVMFLLDIPDRHKTTLFHGIRTLEQTAIGILRDRQPTA